MGNMPILKSHPFFASFVADHQSVMKEFCHTGLSKVWLSHNDLLFSQGEDSHSMFFCVSGRLEYLRRSAHLVEMVDVNCWACEPALWTVWVHAGSMRAHLDSKLLVVQAADFRRILGGSPAAMAYARSYGKNFIENFQQLKRTKMTDLSSPEVDVEEMALSTRRHFRPPGRMTFRKSLNLIGLRRT